MMRQLMNKLVVRRTPSGARFAWIPTFGFWIRVPSDVESEDVPDHLVWMSRNTTLPKTQVVALRDASKLPVELQDGPEPELFQEPDEEDRKLPESRGARLPKGPSRQGS